MKSINVCKTAGKIVHLLQTLHQTPFCRTTVTDTKIFFFKIRYPLLTVAEFRVFATIRDLSIHVLAFCILPNISVLTLLVGRRKGIRRERNVLLRFKRFALRRSRPTSSS